MLLKYQTYILLLFFGLFPYLDFNMREKAKGHGFKLKKKSHVFYRKEKALG